MCSYAYLDIGGSSFCINYFHALSENRFGSKKPAWQTYMADDPANAAGNLAADAPTDKGTDSTPVGISW